MVQQQTFLGKNSKLSIMVDVQVFLKYETVILTPKSVSSQRRILFLFLFCHRVPLFRSNFTHIEYSRQYLVFFSSKSVSTGTTQSKRQEVGRLRERDEVPSCCFLQDTFYCSFFDQFLKQTLRALRPIYLFHPTSLPISPRSAILLLRKSTKERHRVEIYSVQI